MSKFRYVFVAIAGLSLALFGQSTAAEAAPFSEIYVFGDSLVDAGNVKIVSPSSAPAEQGYFQGRFTNGPDYTDLLYQSRFGRYMTPSLLGGSNYAFGGARAADNTGYSPGGDLLPDLERQVNAYAAVAGGSADANALYIVNLMGNDVFAMTSGRINGMAPADYALLVASTLAEQIQRLNDMGARHILVTGVPNLGVPEAHYLQTLVDSALSGLTLEAELLTFSYFDLFSRILADPTAVGLPANLDVTTPCLVARQPSPDIDCTGYFSFDGTHPTAAIHAIIAREIGQLVGIPVSEPASFVLLAAGLGVAYSAARRRRQV